MRVLHVINSLGTGGAETLLRDSLPLVRQSCERVSLLTLSGTEPSIREELRREGIRVFHTGAPSLKSPGQVKGIRRVLGRERPDIVHVHLFPSLYWAALAAGSSSLVYTEHNTWNRRRARALLRPVEAMVYRRYRRISCISEEAGKALIRWIPGIRPRVRVIHNGIATERFLNAAPSPIRREDPVLRERGEIVIMASSFTEKKDHATLIRALALLPRTFALLLPGDGPARGRAVSLADEMGLGNRVVFPGNRNDIPSLMKACDYAVQSSRWEGFGLAAVEAMASGLPVIASRVPGLTEVVRGAGLLFEAGNPEELASAIMGLRGDEELRKRMVSLGFERAQSFHIREMVRKQIGLYRDVLGVNDGRGGRKAPSPDRGTPGPEEAAREGNGCL